MKIEKINEMISGGESITVEFKQSKTKLNRDVFESVCAFLNRNGGHLFLGVNDSGCIVGIDPEEIDKMKKDFITSMNNPLKISPTFYLSVEEVVIDEKIIFYIFVPESSQVHRCNGKIYDRNEDGDIDITDNTNLVSWMYIRKQGSYTENRIFPFAELSELENDVFTIVRKLAVSQRPDHPWKMMDNLELLKSAAIYMPDTNL